MYDPKTLAKEAEELYQKKEYEEGIKLLADPILDELKDTDLYVWRSKMHSALTQYDKALEYANKLVVVNPKAGYRQRGLILVWQEKYDEAVANYDKLIELGFGDNVAYNNRGWAFYKKREYEKALNDFNKAIELKGDDSLYYMNRGNVFADTREYDKAIADYNLAIKFNSNYADAYYNIGNVLYDRGEYDKALEYYEMAIRLDQNHIDAYCNKGNVWQAKGDYDKAIEEYTRAINLKTKSPLVYSNRGLAWFNKGNFELALKDYNEAIELDNSYADAYAFRGLLKEKQGQNDDALEDYDKAVKFSPGNVYANRVRNELFAKMGIPLKFDAAKADDKLYQIAIAVDEIDEEETKLELIKYYKLEIEDAINKIRELSSKIEDDFWVDGSGKPQPKLLAHYSNLKIADLLITKDKTHLRYSNAVFMNDPEEGKTLIDYLDFLEEQDKEEQLIKKSFNRVQNEEKTNFYLGSFLPVKDFHEDELLMWRTYGKDENRNEAAGCCLVIDVEFFDKGDGRLLVLGTDRNKKPVNIVHPLYKVIYCNKRKGKIEGDETRHITNELQKLKDILRGLIEKKKRAEPKLNKAIDRILYHSLSELRYFFKSADYSYENELRVIQFATHPDIVKIDSESGFLPRRMFLESSKEIKPHIRKIVLGPKVQHPERWMYLEEQMKREGYKIEMTFSNCQFQ